MQINPKPTTKNLGGKGYQLHRLREICDVPPFFVIALDNGKNMNKSLILDEFDKHKFQLVSVRSSATVEDGEKASFAGMFESVLNVTRENLIDAVLKVLGSLNGDRVKQYCTCNNIDHSTIKMRIVVQKMICADVSGVCFTKTSNDMQNIIIEACLGLGEALVSGKVTPDNYLVNRNTLMIDSTNIGFQKIMLCQNGYADVPFYRNNATKLTDAEITELAKLSLKIEKELSFEAADIEWAFESGKLYILQARAVTGLSNHSELPSINNYEMTFKVNGLGFLFADLLCRGFGYLHPLFICCDNKFEQYFTNEKMKWAADYGIKWLSAQNGFDDYQTEFLKFHKKQLPLLKDLIAANLTKSHITKFFDILAQYFTRYSKMDFQFTNSMHLHIDKNQNIAENLKKLTVFKDIARSWINEVSVNDDCLLNLFLQKISADFKISVQTLCLYKISELKDLLNNTRIADNIIEERKSCIVYFDGSNTHYFSGIGAQTIVSDIKQQKSDAVSSSVKLKGQTANHSNMRFVTGNAHLLKVDYESHEQMQKAIAKMQSGQILVARFTAPELLAAIKKARAIITDLGGMLSHAAIISREFGIPCLVGTVHATHFFATGDFVKIDLDNGTAEKIETTATDVASMHKN